MTDEQFFMIAGLLTEIRDLLSAGIEAAEAEEGAECAHPSEKRVSLATPAEPDHWVCAACRYEHHGLMHN